MKISNENVLKASENGGFNAKKLGYFYILKILKKKKVLQYGCISYEKLAKAFRIDLKSTSKRNAKIRKILNDMKDFGVIVTPLLKNNDTHIGIVVPSEDKCKSNFTQLPCDLLQIDHMTPELIALFVALNYFKGRNNQINPSYETLMKMLNISDKTLTKLIREAEKVGVIKVVKTRNGRKFINNYYLTDETGSNYLFTNLLPNETKMNNAKYKLEKQQREAEKNSKKPASYGKKTGFKKQIREYTGTMTCAVDDWEDM